MNACQHCNALGCPDEPLASCDRCSVLLCKTCADLTSTELRAVVLKKRSKSITYLCAKCQPCQSDLRPAELDDTILKLIKQQFASFAVSLMADISLELESKISTVQSEVSVLKDSNIDLIKLFTNQKPSLLKPASSAALLDGSKAPPVRRQRSESSASDSLPVACQPPSETLLTLPPQGNSLRTHVSGDGNPRLQKSVPPKSVPPKSVPAKSNSRVVGSAGGLAGNGHSFVIGSRKLNNSKITAANVHKKTSVFVSRLDRSVSTDDLHEYLKSTFGVSESFKVEEQTVKSGDYRSYRVEARLDLLDNLLDPSHWPENVYVKKFRFFRARPPTSG